MIIEFIDRIPEFLSPWVYVPFFFLLWLLIAFNLKRLLIKRLKQITEHTSNQLDDILLSAASMPLNVVIFSVGILFFVRSLPIAKDAGYVTTVLFQCSIILSLVFFIDRFFSKFLKHYHNKIQVGISPAIVRIIVRSIVFGTAALIFLSTIGISITPILASLGIGSLAVGLALQDTLSNLFSGIHIAFDKPIRIGDYVKLESNQEGYVTEIGWRSTRILMLSNDTVIVPNNKLTSTIITNYYFPDKEKIVTVEVSVHYDSDLEKVERVTIEVAKEVLRKTQGGVPNFQPLVRYHTFNSSSIDFTAVLRGKEFVDQYILKHEFVKALQDRYKKEGIIIPYPSQTFGTPSKPS